MTSEKYKIPTGFAIFGTGGVVWLKNGVPYGILEDGKLHVISTPTPPSKSSENRHTMDTHDQEDREFVRGPFGCEVDKESLTPAFVDIKFYSQQTHLAILDHERTKPPHAGPRFTGRWND